MIRKSVFMLAVLAVAACANPINRRAATNYASAAHNAQQAGDWSTARMYWGRAALNAELGRVPPQALAILWYEYGRSSGVICDWAEAEVGLTKAHELDRESNGPTCMSLFELARMNFDRQRYREALTYFDRVLPEFEEIQMDTMDPLGHAYFLDEYATSLEKVRRGGEAKRHRRRSAELRRTFPNREAHTEKTPYGTQCETS